jgi:exodeoxyribonuclease VII large subunit
LFANAFVSRMKPENPESAPELPPIRRAGSLPHDGAITVSQLNQAVNRTLERNFPLMHVQGEISNLTRAASGHWYFTLKDDAAQVKCAMFKGRSQFAGFVPAQGDVVEVRAQVRLYEPRGDYQLVVDSMRRAGAGALLEAFNRLKLELAAEGLFDAERKRTLPVFSRRVGIVTSREAAALRDVAITLAAHAPHVQAILYPTPVQGDGAAGKIAAAIELANLRDEVDVLIVCRGGGSIEDLWAFNEAVVARAMAASRIPIVSGVGHETDITIADFVADVRAPTPTAAAQMAVRSRGDWLQDVAAARLAMHRAGMRMWERLAMRLDATSGRLQSPARQIAARLERIDTLWQRLGVHHGRRLEAFVARLGVAKVRWHAATPDLAAPARQVEHLQLRLARATVQCWQQRDSRLGHLAAVLEASAPQSALRRGYAIVEREGQLLGTAASAQIGDRLTVRMGDGALGARVESVAIPAPDAGLP